MQLYWAELHLAPKELLLNAKKYHAKVDRVKTLTLMIVIKTDWRIFNYSMVQMGRNNLKDREFRIRRCSKFFECPSKWPVDNLGALVVFVEAKLQAMRNDLPPAGHRISDPKSPWLTTAESESMAASSVGEAALAPLAILILPTLNDGDNGGKILAQNEE
uniref:Uncharacterized protein n=1 Tax=Romanomermis culicivorax TaxID=13658 RepID=A0A915IYR1_ROMCU